MAIEITAVPGIPEIREGDNLGEIVAGLADLGAEDVVVISQKIVSKAEGRIHVLSEVVPGPEALELARRLEKDPAVVELVLSESTEVLRAERGVIITRTRHGLVCANAGIDSSNLPEEGTVALLPADPDESARRIRADIAAAREGRKIHPGGDGAPAVVISDSFGRAWRLGQGEVAIGCAGLTVLDDWRGRLDREGRELEATEIAVADEAAAAADLARDKTSGTPVVIVRGLGRYVTPEDGPGAKTIQRPRDEDMFGALPLGAPDGEPSGD